MDRYPNDLNDKQTIQVEKGKAIRILFTDFDVETSGLYHDMDYIIITEGDGSTLATIHPDDRSFGRTAFAEEFISKTDTVHVLFHTDSSVRRAGWRLIWGE